MASLQDSLIRTLLQEIETGRGTEAYSALMEARVKPEWLDSPNRELLFFALSKECLFTPIDLARHFQAHKRILDHLATLNNEVMNDYPGAFYIHVQGIFDDYQNRMLDHNIMELSARAPHMTYQEKIAHILGLQHGIDKGSLHSDLVTAQEASEQATQIVNLLESGESSQLLLPYGYEVLDQHLDGMVRGEVAAIIAPTGVGKSALANGIIQKTARKKHVVLVESLEMGAEIWMLRGASADTQINQKSLIRRVASTGAYNAFRGSLSRLGGLPIMFGGKSKVGLSDIERHIRETQFQFGRCDLVVVDYGRLVYHPNSNPVVQAQEIANGLKYMAMDMQNDDNSKIAFLCIWDMPKKENTTDFMPSKADVMYGGHSAFADIVAITFPYAYKDTHEGKIRHYAEGMGFSDYDINTFWLTEQARSSAWCKIVKARNSQDNLIFAGMRYIGEYTRWECE